MAARSYIADLPGGTATTTIQMTGRQTLKRAAFSFVNAAAGKIELSTVGASQIGTAQPTADVIARLSVGAGAANNAVQLDINAAVQPFQSIYVHQTGAGNLGTVVLS